MTLLTKTSRNNYPSIFDQFFKDEFFEDFFGKSISILRNPSSYGKINVIENDNNYQIEVSLPGASKDAVNIDIVDNTLSITSKSKDEYSTTDKNYIRQEFSYTEFSRSFVIPADVVNDNIDAKFDNGILTITLVKQPKVEAKKRVIEIK